MSKEITELKIIKNANGFTVFEPAECRAVANESVNVFETFQSMTTYLRQQFQVAPVAEFMKASTVLKQDTEEDFAKRERALVEQNARLIEGNQRVARELDRWRALYDNAPIEIVEDARDLARSIIDTSQRATQAKEAAAAKIKADTARKKVIKKLSARKPAPKRKR